MMRIAMIAFTQAGCVRALALARGLRASAAYGDADCSVSGPPRFADELGVKPYESLEAWTATWFARADALVFVGASGIAVRAIAPHVRDKFSDPAVVSIDEKGAFAVPLLSGHVGGANGLARALAQISGGQAAVSTATDVNGLFAVDEWAARQGLAIVERAIAKRVSAALLEGTPVGCSLEYEPTCPVPPGVTSDDADIGFVVSLDDAVQPFAETLHLVPRVATLGVGCRRGTDAALLEAVVREVLAQAGISMHAITTLASIDVKRDELAIQALAQAQGWCTRFYSAGELAEVPGDFDHSDFVERTVGVGNVCERAACAEGGQLIVPKAARDGVTVAVAMSPEAARRVVGSSRRL